MATLEQRIRDLVASVAADIKSLKTSMTTVQGQVATPAVLPAGSTITLSKPTGGSWPGVPTTRSDIVIIWKGADPPPPIVQSRTLGSAGYLDNVDIRLAV